MSTAEGFPGRRHHGRTRENPRLGRHAPRASTDLAAIAPHHLKHHAELRLPHLPGLGAGTDKLLQRCLYSYYGRQTERLGRPFPEVWPETWDIVGPIAARAMRGEASYFEDMPLTLMRSGYPEQTWFSFSYSPVRDETGGSRRGAVHASTRPPSGPGRGRPARKREQTCSHSGAIAGWCGPRRPGGHRPE